MMDLVLCIIILIVGYIGVFGIGLTVGILYKDIFEWRKSVNENNKKISF